MRQAMKFFLALAASLPTLGQAEITSFKHVVIIFQENRTPDNLFQGLCQPPYGTASSCSPASTGKRYNIKTKNWRDKTSPSGVTQPLPAPLNSAYDLGHGHPDFVLQCNKDPSGKCQMDGAAFVRCMLKRPTSVCLTQPQFRYVVSTEEANISPYLALATQYGWANYMFQTNQGPSFPAHQYIFGTTSAPNAEQDAAGFFVVGNAMQKRRGACNGDPTALVRMIDPEGNEDTVKPSRPCFERQTLADLLSAHNPPITWRYYTPNEVSAWNAPNAIEHICLESDGNCTGAAYLTNVDVGRPANVLTDINNCNLRQVSWIMPSGENSDHAGLESTSGGPDWVASIVNTIGNSPCGYWKDTAIFITWDDWGGWYDHVRPTILPYPHGGYHFGFRVPMIVVSAYTPAHFVENGRHEFGSIARFIEQNYGIGNLGLGDARCDPSWITCQSDNLRSFFKYNQLPREFKTITTTRDAAYFINDRTPSTDPDDDVDEE